ncbi:MAG: hypothetical protein AAB410_04945 [Patescibacteria group bacterium]
MLLKAIQDLRIEPSSLPAGRQGGIFRGFLEAYSWYDDKNRRKITKKLAKAAFKDPAPPVLKAAVRKSCNYLIRTIKAL